MQALSNARAAVKNALPPGARPRSAFDLKGLTTSLTVLRLRTKDLALVERQLRTKVAQFPQFFQDAPILIDLGALEEDPSGLSLQALVHVLRACRVMPVAVTNAPEALRESATVAGLGLLSGQGRAREVERGGEEPGAEAAPAAAPAPAPVAAAPEPAPAAPPPRVVTKSRIPLVVRQAVRSGQVVYAEQTDLIVLAPVNPGAQLVADGNIHVYAPLRGRALAGAHGFPEARIFCQRLEAELVSIGDSYIMADDVPETRWGKPSQIFLENGECRLAAL
jgi:septum site-determining protein MinC